MLHRIQPNNFTNNYGNSKSQQNQDHDMEGVVELHSHNGQFKRQKGGP